MPETHKVPEIIEPPATIGILGGGQLGQMLSEAAQALGYTVFIYCPQAGDPAEQVSQKTFHGEYLDFDRLRVFADASDVVTYEFENIPPAAIRFLEDHICVRPGSRPLEIIQDRWLEKSFVSDLDIPTAPFANVETADDLSAATAAIGTPAILKTRRMGYDGKGQQIIRATPDGLAALTAWNELGQVPCILEGFIDFSMELSVVAARGTDGNIVAFDAAENRHKNHILDTSQIPARLTALQASEALNIAETIGNALQYTGVYTVELFLGRDGHLLVNELAPRVHNSGHWSIEGATTSQFEQHIRAICGLPLGDASRKSDAVMTNLIGDDVERYAHVVDDAAYHVHLYGKDEPRPGRKMGHVTRLYPVGEGPEAVEGLRRE